jgi:protein-L-isoaspartate(D-aspartate) O-methyltransferase
VPQPLVEQLKEGGRMIIPVGERFEQMLYRYTKTGGKLVAEPLRPTLFVPMTGTAESGREVQPDPLHPHLVNFSFEEEAGSTGEPRGWYYCRQMKIDQGADAPDGKRFLTFANSVPGRMSRALQGFAIDGKKIGEIEVNATIRGRNIQAGQSHEQLPQISLTYYDDSWTIIGRTFAGPFRGTFDWHPVSEKLRVPPKATKCIMHLGLLGGTGEFSIDNVAIRPIPR